MTIIRYIATAIMTAGFGFFGFAKIAQLSVVTDADSWDRLGTGLWAIIGALELAAVVSLLLALSRRFRRLGVAAATGLSVLAVCAVVFHLANGDAVDAWIPAVIQGAVAATYAAITERLVRSNKEPMGAARIGEAPAV